MLNVECNFPWLKEKIITPSNISTFETLLFHLKNYLSGKMVKSIIDMLYDCIHRLTFENSDFNSTVLVDAINEYGLKTDWPFVIFVGKKLKGKKLTNHSLVQIANKSANRRKEPFVKSEMNILGFCLKNGIPKKIDDGCALIETIPSRLPDKRMKLYIHVSKKLANEKSQNL